MFANSLTDEQLNSPIVWWGDERGGKVHDIAQLDEDYISDGESYSPKSTYEPEILSQIADENHGVMLKGTPILWVD